MSNIIDLNYVVVYNQTRKTPNIASKQPNPIRPEPAPSKPSVDKHFDDITDKDGFDGAYSAEHDMSIISNTMYISGTLSTELAIYGDLTNIPNSM